MTNPEEQSAGQHFLITLRPARATFLADATDEERRIVSAHFQYLVELAGKGVVRLAGRTDEERPLGIVLVKAPSLAEAERVLKNDPAVAKGMMRAELAPFRMAVAGPERS